MRAGGRRYALLADYDWFWRLDSDSFLLARPAADPFARLAARGLVYGYLGVGREDEYLTTGPARPRALSPRHPPARHNQRRVLRGVRAVRSHGLAAPVS